MNQAPVGAGRRFGVAAPGSARAVASDHPPIQQTRPASSLRRRTMRTPLVILAPLCLTLGAFAIGRFTARKPATTVVATAKAVASGTKITAADLRTVVVQGGRSTVLAGALRSRDLSATIGMFARSSLPSGAMVTGAELSGSGGIPGPDQALVGLALKPGQLPADGLAVGDRVGIIDVPAQPAPEDAGHPVVIGSAPVVALGPRASSADTTSITIAVPTVISAALAGQAARGDISVIRLDPHSSWPTSSASQAPSGLLR